MADNQTNLTMRTFARLHPSFDHRGAADTNKRLYFLKRRIMELCWVDVA